MDTVQNSNDDIQFFSDCHQTDMKTMTEFADVLYVKRSKGHFTAPTLGRVKDNVKVTVYSCTPGFFFLVWISSLKLRDPRRRIITSLRKVSVLHAWVISLSSPSPPLLAVLLPLCHINVYLTGWKTACLFPVISERERERTRTDHFPCCSRLPEGSCPPSLSWAYEDRGRGGAAERWWG